jgi:hypothetical protein
VPKDKLVLIPALPSLGDSPPGGSMELESSLALLSEPHWTLVATELAVEL